MNALLEIIRKLASQYEEEWISIRRHLHAHTAAPVETWFHQGGHEYPRGTSERIVAFFRSLVSRRAQPAFDALLARVDRGLSGVVRGQLLICAVNGVLTAIGLFVLGVKYWPTLSLMAGVMSLVPIFGSILSSIPIVAIALTQSFGQAVA